VKEAQSPPQQNCQAIIEGIRCLRRGPVAEFKIAMGNTAICIALCESCMHALAHEHSEWKFTRMSDFH
jgi:hypothetical protein